MSDTGFVSGDDDQGWLEPYRSLVRREQIAASLAGRRIPEDEAARRVGASLEATARLALVELVQEHQHPLLRPLLRGVSNGDWPGTIADLRAAGIASPARLDRCLRAAGVLRQDRLRILGLDKRVPSRAARGVVACEQPLTPTGP